MLQATRCKHDARSDSSHWRKLSKELGRLWRHYQRWRTVRATRHVLHGLDCRTLHDIGIDRSEIESVTRSIGQDRRPHRFLS
jgi:uncharacterized protein YjiS (DUF1127 family)